MTPAALSGLRVLDLSRILAGPYAGQMLGDLGADVIKVERPWRGDDSRQFGPPFLKDQYGADTRESPMYLSANRNKRSIAVDIASASGRRIVRALAAMSDVVIENFKVGDLARHGLDYESLRAINPRLVYCSLTGFGQTGPYRNRMGYDPIFQAIGGLMSVTGLPDDVPGGGPMKVGPSIVDVIAALYADNAILAALRHRDSNGGSGQFIDLSLLDCCVAAMSHSAMHYLVSGTPPPRRGATGNGGSPGGLYCCSDGDVMIAPGNDEQYRRLCGVLGLPGLGNDPRFLTNSLRVTNREAIVTLLEAATISWRAVELTAALEAAGVPAGPVNDLAGVFADPQVRHRGMAVEAAHPQAGTLQMVASPIRLSATPITSYAAPPLLGAHTAEILTTLLGFDAAAIAALAAEGAIGLPDPQ